MPTRRTPDRVAFVSLGCAKNLVDSEQLLAQVGSAGCAICASPDDADTLIINTCAFINEATEESLRMIRQAVELKKARRISRIIVTGCLAQRYAERLRAEIPEVDYIVPLGRFDEIVRLCGGEPSGVPLTTRLRLTPRCFAYLRVSEGCDNRCSYCVIPMIRGSLRSRPLDEVVREAEELVSDGTRELNIIAQDTAAYGMDTVGRSLLPDLIERLSDIRDLRWIRVLYMHPAHLTEELVDFLAQSEKVCNYIDLPIQHINDRILQLMGRRVTRAQLERLIGLIRERIPDVFIRTTVIVGFPSEGEVEFEELLDFLRRTRFERLGAFIYSREEGTRAAELPNHVPDEVKEERFRLVMEQQQEISAELNRKMVGRRLEVMIETPSEEMSGYWEGRAYTDAPEVDGRIFVSGQNLACGQFHLVEITDAREYDLIGNSVERLL